MNGLPDIYAPTTKNIIAFSGGKDSVATCLHAIDLGVNFEMVFSDTGNEHPITIDYVKNFHHQIGIDDAVKIVKADFKEDIKRKRMFIARDNRVRKKRTIKRDEFGNVISIKTKPVRYTNKQKRRILQHLMPTGIPFLDLCMLKGRFPSRMAQFCSEMLKVHPAIEQAYIPYLDSGFNVIVWQGIRAEESRKRAALPVVENVGGGLWNYRPIHQWLVDDVFEIMRKHNVEPNPLYKMAMGRVGCMPCINCTKQEVFEMNRRFPDHVEKINEWEHKVALVSKRGAATFFGPGKTGKGVVVNINDVVQWSKTSRGNANFDLFSEFEDTPVCSSSYGLCE